MKKGTNPSSARKNSSPKTIKMKKGKRDHPDVHECVMKLPKKFKVPDLGDLDEMQRLMSRIPPILRDDEEFECAICRSDDHYCSNCPCLDKVPAGVVLTPCYDFACNGCGTIGKDCCSQGAFAVFKVCGGCRGSRHWYWEKKCPKDYQFCPWIIRLPFTEYVEVPCTHERFKDGPNWLRMVHDNKSDDEDEEAKNTKQPKNVRKKIVRAGKKKNKRSL